MRKVTACTYTHTQRLARHNGVKEEESSWYWDPPPQTSKLDNNAETHYKVQIRALQDELSTLKERETVDLRPDVEEEIRRLREENRNLTSNLEDLDNQHQQAMDRLLSLKKELQRNFEVLKQDHEDLKSGNDEYAEEIQTLLEKVGERDKEIENIKTVKSDYETLHNKYQNLERIYALLRENAEKFQEENQDLNDEVFKLQEQVTKLEHDLEILAKNAEVSTTVPKEKYDEVLKELNDFKDRRNANQIHLDETNIDDNAKSVIENLKHEINDLRHQLNQKEDSQGDADHKIIKADKIMQLYNKYVNFEIPLDYVGEIPSVGDSLVIYKLESVFKTVNSFKKEIDSLEHQISEKNQNINHLQDQIDELTTENDFLTTDIQHFERELNEMKKNNDFLISEITTLKNTSKLEPIIETNHEDNLAKLETELADCNKVNKTFESEIKRIETELVQVRNEKTSLQESLIDLKTKYTTMLSEIDMCKNKTEAVEELEKSVHCQQNESLKTAIDEIDDLKKKLAAVNSKNEQLSIDIHIIENDKVLLTKQVDDLKHTIEEKASAHKELEALKLALDHKLQDFETKLDEVILHKNEIEIEKLNFEKQVALLKTQQADNLTINKGEVEIITEQKNKLSEELYKLQAENTSLAASMTNAVGEIKAAQTKHQELNEEIERVKDGAIVAEATKNSQTAHNQEVEYLKANIEKLEHGKKQLQSELSTTDTKIIHLEQKFEKLLNDIDEKDELIDALNSTIEDNKTTIINLNNTIAVLKKTAQEKDEELVRLKVSTESISSQLASSTEKYNQSQEELNNVQKFTREIGEASDTLKQEIELRKTQISSLQTSVDELELIRDECKIIISNKDKEIKELSQSLVEFKDRNKTPENVHQNDDYASLVQEKKIVERQLLELKNSISIKENEFTGLKATIEQLEGLTANHKTVIDNAEAEKTELLKYLNLKHNESVQYHNEIQRLNQVLLEKENASKHIIEDTLIQNNAGNCTHCENFRITLKEKDAIIKTLNENSAELQRLKSELANADEVVRNLTERCDNTDRSLEVQLEVVKKLTAENAQLSEQEQNSLRELERLRRHLVETEESYTQELMTSEQKLTECQTRLHTVEERAKQTSTVYTSSSIRANQEVETLRTQIKLLEKQREEVQARLSAADDAASRGQAALTNLQIVLEQFQLGKQREELGKQREEVQARLSAADDATSRGQAALTNLEIALEQFRLCKQREEARLSAADDATSRGQATLTNLQIVLEQFQLDIKRENSGLHDEIVRLNNKLDESLAGLQAASRLGDQLDTRTAQMNDLKEQVRTLQTSVAAAEERLQVLRVLSTVLDFNQQECERLGLVRAAAPDSLAAEFVKFLQNDVETSSQLSRDSVEPRQTLDTGVNQTRNNEGAILKHVLRDM
ncbi:putative slender lobes protein [Operophtera brumata]|uniref:Putative slender lobes protein n=1 Tax=Operophtera brumata TaxID=104452 RepID=A0A0L7LCP3_OPEBR|nr:putative slender lobes protein [Operophtera brumata]